MSESLRNDGRVWVPMKKGDKRPPNQIPENERDYYLETRYPSFGNLAPRDVTSRAAKLVCDAGRGVGATGLGVYLDFSEAIGRLGRRTIEEKYGNLFEMYERITGEDAYEVPMRIFPAIHYTMGGLWVDYNLMSTIPGLFVLGEANFSDHGANRLGASALMQGLSDGYFVLPTTIGNYFGSSKKFVPSTDAPEFKEAEERVIGRLNKLMSIKGSRTPTSFHRELGKLLWDNCGMARSEQSLKTAIKKIQVIRDEFWKNLKLVGATDELNQTLEYANRVSDYMEFAEMLCKDALERRESCGGHFRVEYQTEDNEAKRDDENFAHVAVWEYKGEGKEPVRNVEPLKYEVVKMTQRSYK